MLRHAALPSPLIATALEFVTRELIAHGGFASQAVRDLGNHAAAASAEERAGEEEE